MKTYEVELRRTSFVTITVEAENEDEAGEKVWSQADGADGKYATWEVESVEELKGESK